MNPETVSVIQSCAAQSLAGEIEFPEVIGRLAAVGVERYHADYCRAETTYYLANGESLVVATPHPQHLIGATFFANQVEAAIRQSQKGEHRYVDFVRKTMTAGCVGYFVQIVGQRAIYFGRNGDSHVERFPQAASS